MQPADDREPENPHPQKPLLVIAHPGHELRLYGWLGQVHADVAVLTTGAGRTGHSRTESSRRVLDEVGATPSCIFGRYSDQAIYSAFLRSESALFVELAEDLAALLLSNQYRFVVADPLEGYNPTHDLCRVLVDMVVQRVSADTGRLIETYDYPLVNPIPIPARSSDDICISLEASVLARKINAACSYPELAGEVDMALEREGIRRQGEERLRRVAAEGLRDDAFAEPPFYELYAEGLRASGHYASVLRYREHFVPIAEALAKWAA